MRIHNCHVHIFNHACVPDRFISRPLQAALRRRWFRRRFVGALRWLWPFDDGDMLERYANFVEDLYLGSQEEVLRHLLGHYPGDARFVILPMDMSLMGLGRVGKSVTEQHDELLALCRRVEFADRLLPFVHVDPRHTDFHTGIDPVAFITRYLDTGLFRGIKLYPPLGYLPTDRSLEPIWRLADERALPVMTHCTPGGSRGPHCADLEKPSARNPQGLNVAHPAHYEDILRRYPRMRLCLGHFGGGEEWLDYLRNPYETDGRPAPRSWPSVIMDMLRRHPNLWTDISYTIMGYDRGIKPLKVFLQDPLIRSRVLFGSDFYVNDQERFPERQLALFLRADLGEELFATIAETNPHLWLGL